MFVNKYNIEALDECKEIISAVRNFVGHLDSYIQSDENFHDNCFAFVMQMISESIVEYGKEAYNCLERGDFYALGMLIRVIIENYVCLMTIGEDPERELWKYWLASSYAREFNKYKTNRDSEYIRKLVEDYFKENSIDSELMYNYNFYNNYGWTRKSKKRVSMHELADDIDGEIYNDYQQMCAYTHGTSAVFKRLKIIETTPIYMITTLVTYLNSTARYYYFDCIDEEYENSIDLICSLSEKTVEESGRKEIIGKSFEEIWEG